LLKDRVPKKHPAINSPKLTAPWIADQPVRAASTKTTAAELLRELPVHPSKKTVHSFSTQLNVMDTWLILSAGNILYASIATRSQTLNTMDL